MQHSTTGRTTARSRVASAAVVSLVALAAFVALAFVARPAPAPAVAPAGPVQVGQVAPGGHPDFVAVAETRPSVGVAHLLALPTSSVSLIVALVTVVVAVGLRGSVTHSSRWRRWRARLEGAPPLVA